MAEKTANTNNGFQQVFVELKKYLRLRSDYLQVMMVEKSSKIFSKIIFGLIAFVLLFGVFFYLMFALAYALVPLLGQVVSFIIIAAIFLVLLLIVVIFKKQLIITPILRMLVDVFYDETKEEGKQNDEDNATTT